MPPLRCGDELHALGVVVGCDVHYRLPLREDDERAPKDLGCGLENLRLDEGIGVVLRGWAGYLFSCRLFATSLSISNISAKYTDFLN